MLFKISRILCLMTWLPAFGICSKSRLQVVGKFFLGRKPWPLADGCTTFTFRCFNRKTGVQHRTAGLNIGKTNIFLKAGGEYAPGDPSHLPVAGKYGPKLPVRCFHRFTGYIDSRQQSGSALIPYLLEILLAEKVM